MRNVTVPNKTNGIIYATHPKMLSRKSAIASPTNPPIPKLLSNSKMLTASVTQIIISSLTKLCSEFFLFVCFLLPRFLDLAAILYPPYSGNTIYSIAFLKRAVITYFHTFSASIGLSFRAISSMHRSYHLLHQLTLLVLHPFLLEEFLRL